jgi:signal transduction histidine kinase
MHPARSRGHVCVPAHAWQDQLEAAAAFMRAGLERREQCIFIAKNATSTELADLLQRANVPTEGLSIIGADSSYLRGGTFEADRMIEWLAERVEAARSAGLPGTRLVGEVACVWDPCPDPARLIEYEAKLDGWMIGRPISVMCLYDRARMPARVVRNMFATHPLVVVDARVHRNLHHMSPATVLASSRADAEVDEILAGFRTGVLADERLHSHRRQLLAVQEAERRAIARELHDGFGQLLVAIQLGLHETPIDVDELDALTGEAVESVRSLALELRPAMLDDLGLAAAVRAYVRRVARDRELAIDLTVDDIPVPAAIATTCFRLVQEAVLNIVRHADAHRVAIEIRSDGGCLTLAVHDDGVGFDPGRPGLGIVGMTERTALAGGELTVESTPGAGTTVRARLPIGDGA